MFDELSEYDKKGHFFFNAGESLSKASADVPAEPGVFYIMKLAGENIEMVYIGKAGSVAQTGDFDDEVLFNVFEGKMGGVPFQEYLDQKMNAENIDALDIYWFATFDGESADLPSYVQSLMLQEYFDMYDRLPAWNRKF